MRRLATTRAKIPTQIPTLARRARITLGPRAATASLDLTADAESTLLACLRTRPVIAVKPSHPRGLRRSTSNGTSCAPREVSISASSAPVASSTTSSSCSSSKAPCRPPEHRPSALAAVVPVWPIALSAGRKPVVRRGCRTRHGRVWLSVARAGRSRAMQTKPRDPNGSK